MTRSTTSTPATARADAVASAGRLADIVNRCPDTDVGHTAALRLRLKAALAALQRIEQLRYAEDAADEMYAVAEDALYEDSHAEDATPPTAMQMLEDWQAAHKDRDARMELCGYWMHGVCRVTLEPHAGDEYSRMVIVDHADREQAIRRALEWWEENCERGRAEEAELDAQ